MAPDDLQRRLLMGRLRRATKRKRASRNSGRCRGSRASSSAGSRAVFACRSRTNRLAILVEFLQRLAHGLDLPLRVDLRANVLARFEALQLVLQLQESLEAIGGKRALFDACFTAQRGSSRCRQSVK
jgi:hypothetical protein